MQPVAPRHPDASVKRAASFILLTIYALITFGCGNSSPNSMLTGPASAQVRVVQGGVNGGIVDVLVNGAKAQTRANPLATPPYFAGRVRASMSKKCPQELPVPRFLMRPIQ
jgi:hypothetical protein